MRKPDVSIVTMTVAWAKRLLAAHDELVKRDELKRNRRTDPQVVSRYRADMTDGNWLLDGNSIKIGLDGRIIDGKHRLEACVLAGVAFPTVVITGVCDAAFTTTDVGLPRTLPQLLTLGSDPQKNGKTLAAALGVIWRYEKGQPGARFKDWGRKPTYHQAADVLSRHRDVVEYVGKARTFRGLLSEGLGAALWYLFSRENGAIGEDFFSRLITGTDLKASDPVFVLRERLRRDYASRPRPGVPHQVEMVMKAWTAVIDGKPIQRLQRGRRAAAVQAHP